MNIGRMDSFIDIIQPTTVRDEEGFTAPTEVILASVRAYREGRHGSKIWANRAAFSEATDLFRFRVIPGVQICTDQIIRCDTHRFVITSVEDVHGRGMYIDVLCKEVRPSGEMHGSDAG